MAIADDLRTSAQRFYALARKASDHATKLQLVALGDDYLRQANELRREQLLGDRSPQKDAAIIGPGPSAVLENDDAWPRAH
jgi:hypothetical protein